MWKLIEAKQPKWTFISYLMRRAAVNRRSGWHSAKAVASKSSSLVVLSSQRDQSLEGFTATSATHSKISLIEAALIHCQHFKQSHSIHSIKNFRFTIELGFDVVTISLFSKTCSKNFGNWKNFWRRCSTTLRSTLKRNSAPEKRPTELCALLLLVKFIPRSLNLSLSLSLSLSLTHTRTRTHTFSLSLSTSFS